MEDSAPQGSFLGAQGFFTKELGIGKEGAYDAAVAEVCTGPFLYSPNGFLPQTVRFCLQLAEFAVILPTHFLLCVAPSEESKHLERF